MLLLGIAALGSECGITRETCSQWANCRVVMDQNVDGEIADDLRRARNELLYGPESFDIVYLFPPDSGTYTWTGEVRFCGDDSFAADPPPPGDESEPDCDGNAAIPQIVFAGDWTVTPFDADCAAGDTTPFKIYACLRIGDTFEGDAGAAELRPRVSTESDLSFTHVAVPPFWYNTQPTYAVWLDGISDSFASFEVGTVPGLLGGMGAYVAARESDVSVRMVPDNQIGLVLDGDMSGSSVHIDADYSAEVGGPNQVVMVGTAGSSWSYGPQDGCEYGADPVGSCSDFTLSVFARTPDGPAGGEVVHVWDGTGIALQLDVEYRTWGHIPVGFDGTVWGGSAKGEVGEVTVEGSLVYAGLTEDGINEWPAIGVHDKTEAHLDLTVENLNFADPECLLVGHEATVVLEPNYQCIGTGTP
jgi:hypothetical protein